MKKKRHVPAPQRSAFEDAKAALERAGEDPSELKKTPVETAPTPDSSETSAPVENAQASEPETADGAAPETVTAETAEASAPETADDAETPVPAFAPEVADSAEASETASDAETESEASETAEASEPEASDSAETPVSEMSDGAEAGSASETDEPDSEENIAATPETNAEPSDAPAPESDDDTKAYPLTTEAEASDSDADEEASEPLSDEEDASEDGGDVWEYADEPESEIAETERHTMETKEITVGYHPIRTANASEHSGTEATKSKKKPRFKALDAFKDAFQSHAEQEQEEQGDGSPTAGSSRDAALRKRVMQIEDDETRNYLLDRVLPQMTWYSKRSAQYQKMYYRLMAATILMGALIPVFAVGGSYGAVKVILALLGASVTAINAYLALHKYQELWVAYRTAREDLIHTLYSYFNQAGVFAQKKMSQKELDVLLVEVCENALSKENGGWTTTVLQKS